MGNALQELRVGIETAYIDSSVSSGLAYRPSFVSNNRNEGKKVIASIEDELMACDQFQISVAFITMSGVTMLLQTLKELEEKGIPGQILTTNYLSFSQPNALEKLNSLNNITLKMFDVEASNDGFHTKGYIFRKEEIYRIIIGSSNMTSSALTTNREWNTRIVSTEQGEVAQQILQEYHELWNSPHALEFDDFIESYKVKYEIIKQQREIVKKEKVASLEAYKLKPNSMQVDFIKNLQYLIDKGEKRALLISATGTGKTYASAFALRSQNPKKALFLVHREQIAKQAMASYQRVFGSGKTFGLLSGNSKEYDADYMFATMQMMSRSDIMQRFKPNQFDFIVIDEAHRSGASSYQKIMEYYTPDFWLGMTASPERTDAFDVFEAFDHNVACEIRLQQAMEENLLCPFHYFGITEIEVDGELIGEKTEFNRLASDARVDHILSKAEYFGYSGDRVKGLIFCRSKDEAASLSIKMNAKGYRTIDLTGEDSQEKREDAINRLVADDRVDYLDYILTIDIFNEGVDIPEINQVIMLRPTISPIVFVQQLGRGLRKADDKDYIVILDFIGNYQNNFMIPIALSGDRTYDKDSIRQYVISGNSTIPGESTVHFDAIAKNRIFHSIDKIRGMKSIIKASYTALKHRLGRIPYLQDFYENGEIDPLVIIKEYKTYEKFLNAVEKDWDGDKISEHERLTLEYLSKTILSGVRPYELEILKRLFKNDRIDLAELSEELKNTYEGSFDTKSLENAIDVLEGRFVSKEEEYQRYKEIGIIKDRSSKLIQRMDSFKDRLQNEEFYNQIDDIVNVGLARYSQKYGGIKSNKTHFVLYEKYSRRDVCLLMNCGKDLSSTMYGMKKIDDDVFIFVTYHKVGADNEDLRYVEGKPDYADAFTDNIIFRWDSQIGKGPDSSYMKEVKGAARKHLMVKKSDAETKFYYMGTFDVVSAVGDKKMDNRRKMKDITKVTFKMHYPVREDILKYLESSLLDEEYKPS